jgi:D-alanyl-D-alanine dipeptidase
MTSTRRPSARRRALLAAALPVVLFAACARPRAAAPSVTQQSASALLPGPIPAPPAERWLGLIGEYGPDDGVRFVLEERGQIRLADTAGHFATMTEVSPSEFSLDRSAAARVVGRSADRVVFTRDASGRASEADVGGLRLARRNIEPQPGTNQLRITPVRPVSELRTEALAASPPAERGSFHAPELVELTRLDPTIKLEVRYATSNNFLGTPLYDQGRAFAQRPAAEAVARANQALRPLGYGLLIHDAYRPWYVTKIFWDATPVDKHWLVANPAEGSKHNRGAAIDLSMFDLATGQPVEMPSTYDESTARAYANYPGGTSRQRWHRLLLRRAMESQGFIVNPQEWWHFDYKNWRDYPIGNVTFDRIGGS